MADSAVAETPAAPAAESILDGAQAPSKEGEPSGQAGAGKSADAAGKVADGAAKADEGTQGKDGAAKPNGAPEKYEAFKAPEGVTLDTAATEKFTALAKELNLSQDAAQKLVDFQTSAIKNAQDGNLKAFEQMQKDWADQTRKELGANADKELGFAALGRDKFAPKESGLNKILNESGLANHPEVIKHFIAIGKTISEDRLTEGKPDTGGKAEKTVAQRIYPDQK